MAKLSKDLGLGTLHPRETLFASGSLGAVAAEVTISADGAASVVLDLRGTFSLSVIVEATADGSNWGAIPMRPLNAAGVGYAVVVAGTAAGVWTGSLAGFRQVRARCSAYTSGAATATLTASIAPLEPSVLGAITPLLVTGTAASGSALTLTLPAGGSGLRQYLTYVAIHRYAAAVLTASATPVIVTTGNVPGNLAFTFAADAAALGTLDRWREDFAFPLASSAQNSATTIVMPAITGVIWRATAGYYLAP